MPPFLNPYTANPLHKAIVEGEISTFDVGKDCTIATLLYVFAFGNPYMLREIMTKYMTVNSVSSASAYLTSLDSNLVPAIMYAAHYRNNQQIVFIRGIMPAILDVVDQDGKNIMHYAAAVNNSDLIPMFPNKLLEYDNNRRNAYHHAAMHRSAQFIQGMQHLNANTRYRLFTTDNSGYTPIHYSIMENDFDSFSSFGQISRNVLDMFGNNEFMIAILHNSSQFINHYFRQSAVGLTNRDGYTALQLAILKNNQQLVERLYPREGMYKSKASETCLHVALKCNNVAAAVFLDNEDEFLFTQDNEMNLPIHLALMYSTEERSTDLFYRTKSIAATYTNIVGRQTGFNIFALQNSDGNTPAHLAAMRGFIDITYNLRDICSNIRNKKGRTPSGLIGNVLEVDQPTYINNPKICGIVLADPSYDFFVSLLEQPQNISETFNTLAEFPVNFPLARFANGKSWIALYVETHGRQFARTVGTLLNLFKSSRGMQDNDGNTILHFLATLGFSEILYNGEVSPTYGMGTFIVSFQTEVSIRNNAGKLPMDVAEDYANASSNPADHAKVMKEFKRYGSSATPSQLVLISTV